MAPPPAPTTTTAAAAAAAVADPSLRRLWRDGVVDAQIKVASARFLDSRPQHSAPCSVVEAAVCRALGVESLAALISSMLFARTYGERLRDLLSEDNVFEVIKSEGGQRNDPLVRHTLNVPGTTQPVTALESSPTKQLMLQLLRGPSGSAAQLLAFAGKSLRHDVDARQLHVARRDLMLHVLREANGGRQKAGRSWAAASSDPAAYRLRLQDAETVMLDAHEVAFSGRARAWRTAEDALQGSPFWRVVSAGFERYAELDIVLLKAASAAFVDEVFRAAKPGASAAAIAAALTAAAPAGAGGGGGAARSSNSGSSSGAAAMPAASGSGGGGREAAASTAPAPAAAAALAAAAAAAPPAKPLVLTAAWVAAVEAMHAAAMALMPAPAAR